MFLRDRVVVLVIVGMKEFREEEAFRFYVFIWICFFCSWNKLGFFVFVFIVENSIIIRIKCFREVLGVR